MFEKIVNTTLGLIGVIAFIVMIGTFVTNYVDTQATQCEQGGHSIKTMKSSTICKN